MNRTLACLSLLIAWVTVAAPPQSAAGENYALLIGVTKKTGKLTKLNYPDNDAGALRDALVKRAGGEEYRFDEANVTVLSRTEAERQIRGGGNGDPFLPTGDNIREMLEKVTVAAKGGRMLLVYFSGHGIKIGGKLYLCPENADEGKVDTLLLLDDVSSELDPQRSAQLFDTLRREAGQCVVTTTAPHFIGLPAGEDCRYIEVDKGRLRDGADSGPNPA